MVYDPSYPYHMYGTFKSNGTAQPGDFENAFPAGIACPAGIGEVCDFTVSVRHTDGAGSDGVLHQRGYCLYHTGL